MAEQRSATRYPVQWPVEFDQGAGRTLDMSTTGILFETGQALPRGSSLQLDVLLPSIGDAVRRLRCLGSVVRVEPRGESWGIGLQLQETAFVC